jgi:hypothetical protein
MLFLLATAMAADLPPLPEGTTFTVSDLGTADTYYTARNEVIGQPCTSTGPMTPTGTWYAGPAHCGDKDYRFAQVRVQPAEAVAPPASATVESVSPGDTVVLRDVGPTDAYYADRAALVGKSCTVAGDTTRADGAFWHAILDCGMAQPLVFVEVAFDVAHGAIPAGHAFKILDLSEQDAYYNQKADIVGTTCLALEAMVPKDGPWSGGSAFCDGSEFYFYEASVEDQGESAYAKDVAQGAKFEVLVLTANDPAAPGPVGQQCTASADLFMTGPIFYAGPVECADGQSYWFTQAALKLVDAGGAPPVERFMGTSLPKGASVRIVAVGPMDPWQPHADDLAGETCRVKRKSGLVSAGDGWFDGVLKCDGVRLTFQQVGVVVN